jgi:8-oxo-dGTP pyrophosphatase MutT (NUDIX family)
VRILLAAVNAPKGDLDGNLARHLAVLDQARVQGCHLAVFPELSLTGSVDPRRHPGRALALDAGPVLALLEGTRRAGVAALFGIAEHEGATFNITQVYGHSGRLGGVHRKRHLGEGEEGHQTGGGPGVFQLGAARFGVTLCAEGEAGFPRDAAASAGVAVLFNCSAPGLAALASPGGEVARLADRRPGGLVVEVAADVTVHPVREAVRCLVVDHAGRALLVRYADPRVDGTWWGPPGGGLDPGEDHLAAVRRELREELARDDLRVGPFIGRRCHTFWLGRWMTQRERWVLCRAEPFEVDPAHVTTLAAEAIQELRWWSADELRAAGIVATPRDLPDLLDRVARGDLPGPDQDLGI